MSGDSPAELEQAVERCNDAWNAHDVDLIVSMTILRQVGLLAEA